MLKLFTLLSILFAAAFAVKNGNVRTAKRGVVTSNSLADGNTISTDRNGFIITKENRRLQGIGIDFGEGTDGYWPDKPDGDRPDGDRPSGDRPDGDRPSGDRPSGDRPSGDRPDRPDDESSESPDEEDEESWEWSEEEDEEENDPDHEEPDGPEEDEEEDHEPTSMELVQEFLSVGQELLQSVNWAEIRERLSKFLARVVKFLQSDQFQEYVGDAADFAAGAVNTATNVISAATSAVAASGNEGGN